MGSSPLSTPTSINVAKVRTESSRAERNASRVLRGSFDEIDTKALRVLRDVMVADERAVLALEKFIVH